MRLAQTFRTIYRDLTKKEMTSLPAVPPARGRALMGYLNAAVVSKEDSRLLRSGHTNRWECRNIAHIFSSFGYDVDAINWDNKKFLPSRSYNVHFDISTNMARFHSALPDTQRLLHVTESYPRFNNAAEARRVEEMERRTGVPYAPKRKMLEPDLFDSSLEIADRISLIGNEVTLSTFPERFRDRITLVTPSSSTAFIKPPKALVPPSREFLWFNGAGAVHKGLDLTLEAFRKLPDLRLNVVGNAHEEEDFMRAYGNDLLHAPNITYYGWLRTDGRVFREVMERCCCFISPSCSEGISTSSATAMRAGLYPVISRNNGIDLPPDCGAWLEDCTAEEIAQKAREVAKMPIGELRRQIWECQTTALNRYSRENFAKEMSAYLSAALAEQIKN